ncbi:endonuclease/exonuclease/phosphatase family protein [Barrientosiimonas humi]|uniref:endonuclease/exonuclease/phosphatase family protein n=1 Tax=Barrientosiimonas humi TaxID=999931 RepID=UPI001477520D|nr:endonuclease/exonuclease/phosphatase family protein [Barrientosiimonas humi]
MRQAGMVRRPSARTRRLAAAGLTVLVALLVSTRWWDTHRFQVPVLQAAFPVVGALAVGWAALLLALRHRTAATVLAVLAALVPLLLAGGSLRSDTVPSRPGDQVVMSANLQYGRADPAALVTLVREQRVDVLVLVEVTPDAAAALRRAGLDRLLPQSAGSPRTGADGTVIRSRHPLQTLENAQVPGLFGSPVARVRAPSGTYVVKGVHPYPPAGELVAGWHRQLRDLGRWVRAQPTDEPLVLAGDFNSSSAHPAFREATAGLTDAHGAAGKGWVRTWPVGQRVPPFVQIDHVLQRGGRVVDAGSATVPDTDHAVVWARLRVPG